MVSVEFPTGLVKEKLSSLNWGPKFRSELEEALFTIGMELESYSDEEVKVDLSGSGNRIDCVSLNGLARALLAYCGKTKGFKLPNYSTPRISVKASKEALALRPFIANVVIRNAVLTGESLKLLMNFQEKVHDTFGRNRKRLAIGFYKLSELKPPILYDAEEKSKIRFTPLGESRVMTGEEILEKHDKGVKYAHLFPGKSMTVLKDSAGKYLSIPGIINSNDVGNVQPGRQDLFVDITGSDLRMMNEFLCCVSQDFADDGATIEQVSVEYPTGVKVFPNFNAEKKELSNAYSNTILGLQLKPRETAFYLEKMLFNAAARPEQDLISVEVPPFRSDVLHKIDIVDDVSRAYSFDNFVPEYPNVATVGELTKKTRLAQKFIDSLQGLGFQQVLGMILVNKEAEKKFSGSSGYAEFQGARAIGVNACRKALLPGLLRILKSNKHVDYPQKLFEVGEVIELDENAETGAVTKLHLALVSAHAQAGFSEAKSLAEEISRSFECELKVSDGKQDFLAKGRRAECDCEAFKGSFGELPLETLSENNLEMPCSVLEVEIKGVRVDKAACLD